MIIYFQCSSISALTSTTCIILTALPQSLGYISFQVTYISLPLILPFSSRTFIIISKIEEKNVIRLFLNVYGCTVWHIP